MVAPSITPVSPAILGSRFMSNTSRSQSPMRMGTMRLIPTVLWTWLVLMLAGALPAGAQERIALVIGNGAYRNVPALSNPPADATAIAAALGRLGFSVNTVLDGSFEEIRRAVLEHGRKARSSELAIIYFAGHGMEASGENWLVPVDAELRTDIDAASETVSLRSLMLATSGARRLGLVILDACRNNPFEAAMKRTARDRGLA